MERRPHTSRSCSSLFWRPGKHLDRHVHVRQRDTKAELDEINRAFREPLVSGAGVSGELAWGLRAIRFLEL